MAAQGIAEAVQHFGQEDDITVLTLGFHRWLVANDIAEGWFRRRIVVARKRSFRIRPSKILEKGFL